MRPESSLEGRGAAIFPKLFSLLSSILYHFLIDTASMYLFCTNLLGLTQLVKARLDSPQMEGSVQSGSVSGPSGDFSVWIGSFETYQIASGLLRFASDDACLPPILRVVSMPIDIGGPGCTYVEIIYCKLESHPIFEIWISS